MKKDFLQKYGLFFKSVIDQDPCSVVICDTEHNIVYMNPAAAAAYAKHGGDNLTGTSIFNCHNEKSVERIRSVVDWFSASPANNRVHTFFNEKQNKDVYMIALRDDDGKLIGYYEKHEFRTKDPTPFYDFS